MSFPGSFIKCTKCDYKSSHFPANIVLKYMVDDREFLTGYRTKGWCHKCNGIQDIEKLPTIQKCQSDLAALQSQINRLEKEISELESSFLGRALKKSKIIDLQNALSDAKQEFAETGKRLKWLSKRKSGARCLKCGFDQTTALNFKPGTDGKNIAQGFTHSCGGQLFIVEDEDGPRFAVSPQTITLDMEGNRLDVDKHKSEILNMPKSSSADSVDEEIKLFREDYSDVYDFVLKVLDGNCDKATLQTFKDDYGEEFLNDILKIIYGKASKKDIETFLEEYSEEIYNAIVKMIQNRKPRREDFPEAVHSREKFKRGDFIGQKYEVFGVLGEGGFGIVYLVYSHETKSAYALKTFRHEYLEDVTTRERFKKEARVWINLERHPYLVRAYFVDEISGRLFIAVEHIAPDDEGLNTLEGYLRSRPPDLAQSLRWAIQFCYGMEYAYSRGIKAHRDIKPANIMIGQDKAVKISDFGLAGVIGESKASSGIKIGIQQGRVGFSCQTMEGVGFGTPTHMPPEQFINAAGCDERSDIYSFGVVLYQMATGGKLPFLAPFPQNDSYEESRRFWIEMYKLHLQASAPKLDSSLFPVIRKCLKKEPRKRYQSFRKLRADLEPILKRQTGEIIVLPKAEEYDFWDMGNKAVSLDRLGRYEEAFSYYNQMLKIFPFDELTIFNKAICLTNLKRYKEAVQCYDHIIKSDSESSRAWNNKGLCFEKLGYHEEAMKCFERGLTIDPADTSLLINIGNSFYKRGKYAVASSAYSRVLEINNRDAIAWHNKGLCLYVLGEFNDASTCFSRALSIDPLYEDAWFNQGLAYHNLGDTENAVRSYDRALHLNPQRVAAWINKGKCLYLLGSLVEAIDCYNEALRMDSQNTGAWYNKALFEDKCNRHLDAFSSYKKFIELASPQDHEKIELALKRIQELKETIG